MTASLLPDGLARVLPTSATVGSSGHLEVGGCDLVAIAHEFGTPLYVYDVDDMRVRAREYRAAFSGLPVDGQVVYASKACPIVAVVRLMAETGLWIDVSTRGELEVARRAGVDPATLIVHGNNKSDAELEAALDLGVGRIVIDSLDEVGRLTAAARARGAAPQPVYLRLTPGIEVDTHAFIRTGQEDSKFGLGMADGQALAAVEAISRTPELDLVGVHAHIGSQIFDVTGYVETAAAALGFAAEAARRHGTRLSEIDLGGGLGIAYRPDQTPVPVADLARTLGASVADHAAAAGLDGLRLLVEPGRSLVGRAGATLYTVGVVKESAGRRYVAVDGGMSDNMRPALYGAAYETLLADDPAAPRDAVVDVVGKHCESGDVIAEGTRLPRSVSRGDILVTPATGAYGWTMANNYNMLARPAVVFVGDGNAREVVRRETVDDLLRLMEA
ncbi:MAG: diaminopimelate decarboxylase [Acidimicrobiia bacterium]|nr:diaminopimelate decarboxylase [Acidimicrobiia bacterium]